MIVGYDGGQMQLHVLDPRYSSDPEFQCLPYADYTGASQVYVHGDDFFMITPAP